MTNSLIQFLQQPPPAVPIIGILGADVGIVEIASAHIKQSWQTPHYQTQFHLCHQTEFDWEHWAQELIAPCLWKSAPYAIHLHSEEGKIPATLTQALACVLAAKQQHKILFTREGIDKKFAKTELGVLLAEQGMLYTLWPPFPNQLSSLIRVRAKHYELQFAPAAIDCLTQYYEQDFIGLEQLLKRFKLRAEPMIDLKTLQTDPGLQHQGTLFTVLSAACKGDLAQCSALMQQIPPKQGELLGLLGALSSLLQKSHAVALKLQQTKQPFEKAAEGILWPKQFKEVQAFLARYQIEDIARLLQTLPSLDSFIKSNHCETAWHLLSQVIYAMIKVEWLPAEEITSLSAY